MRVFNDLRAHPTPFERRNEHVAQWKLTQLLTHPGLRNLAGAKASPAKSTLLQAAR